MFMFECANQKLYSDKEAIRQVPSFVPVDAALADTDSVPVVDPVDNEAVTTVHDSP